MERILIVDDSSIMRKNLRLILSREGYNVVAEASNGEEACRAYSAHRPDLVTMDITMPVMNGIDAVKTIIRTDPQARIMVISAFDQRSMLFEAMENGAKHYIIKPITADKLLQAVRQVLGAERPPTAASTGESTRPIAEAQDIERSDPTALPLGEFTVENRNGAFIMSLPGPESGLHIPMARQALQGLLFIKPLAVRFSFPGAERLDHEALQEITAMVRQIVRSGGQAELHADRKSLADILKEAMPDIKVENP
jgi:DNA-binding NarL/FixJ family response regulator